MAYRIYRIFVYYIEAGKAGRRCRWERCYHCVNVNPLHTGFIFYIFARKFVSVRYITEKTDLGGVRI